MKKLFCSLLVCFLLASFLTSCMSVSPERTDSSEPVGKELSSEGAPVTLPETAPPTETHPSPPETIPQTPPETEEPEPDTEEPQDPNHVHSFYLNWEKPSTCIAMGIRENRCECGQVLNEYLPTVPHTPSEATCTSPSRCDGCGQVFAEALGHAVIDGVCVRCNARLSAPIVVLDCQLSFDESQGILLSKLGTPSAVIREGSFTSYVYASDLARLTVIQTDAVGLWGVFTMDPSASFYIDGSRITAASFSGFRDVNSDAYYKDAGSCRIFGFRDILAGGDYYALWMRYSECRYDYMDDAGIYSNYAGQNLLSFYYVNALRVKRGLSPLNWSDTAREVAEEYSAYMIEKDFFDHDGSYGDRLNKKGVFWSWAGENISVGYFNAFFVCDAYFNSAGHRENILSENFTHVGIGFVRREDPLSVYGAQIFYSLP
ncbi:MAG: CAP domain-containing protein [Clostridia bacterium]|nr:CAP domain-containing protein [Clostridia bacterium]